MKTILLNGFSDGAETYAIAEVEIPLEWLGKSVGKIDIRKNYDVNVMALKKDGDICMLVSPETVLTSEKTMLVLGEYQVLQKCFHIIDVRGVQNGNI